MKVGTVIHLSSISVSVTILSIDNSPLVVYDTLSPLYRKQATLRSEASFFNQRNCDPLAGSSQAGLLLNRLHSYHTDVLKDERLLPASRTNT